MDLFYGLFQAMVLGYCKEYSCCNGSTESCYSGNCLCDCKNGNCKKCNGDWSGDTCEISPCETNRCLNGGKCHVSLTEKFYCKCAKGWFGKNCERKMDGRPKDIKRKHFLYSENSYISNFDLTNHSKGL